jgi:hypothetical protein
MSGRRRVRCISSLLVFAILAGPALGERDVPTLEERIRAVVHSTDPPRTIMVMRLRYAEAEELAETLAPSLPPGITVVPHPPTNSLIIVGPPGPPLREVAPE